MGVVDKAARETKRGVRAAGRAIKRVGSKVTGGRGTKRTSRSSRRASTGGRAGKRVGTRRASTSGKAGKRMRRASTGGRAGKRVRSASQRSAPRTRTTTHTRVRSSRDMMNHDDEEVL